MLQSMGYQIVRHHSVAQQQSGCSCVYSLICLSNSFVRLPWGSDAKGSACNARDPGSIPGSERSPGLGGGIPREFHRQRSLEGSSPQGRKESDTTE